MGQYNYSEKTELAFASDLVVETSAYLEIKNFSNICWMNILNIERT